MTLSALRSVGDAIDVTREFLLPTTLGRWARLSLIAVFLGAPGTPLPANPQFADPRFWRGPTVPPPQPSGDGPDPGGGDAGAPTVPSPETVLPDLAGVDVLQPATWPVWFLGAVALALAFALAYAYLGALARFVVVESLRTGDVSLRRDAGAHLRDAAAILAVRVGLALLAVPAAVGVAIAVAPVGPVTVDGVGAVVLGVAAVGVGFVLWIVDTATLQLVVPTMIVEDAGVIAGWRRFWQPLRAAWREYVAFAVVRFVVGTAVGIAAAIGVVLAVGLALVVLGTIGAIVIVLAGGLGSLGTAAVAALLGLLAVLVAYGIAAAAAIAAPFQIYLWSYALLVLGDTDADLDLIPDLRAAARETDRLGSI